MHCLIKYLSYVLALVISCSAVPSFAEESKDKKVAELIEDLQSEDEQLRNNAGQD